MHANWSNKVPDLHFAALRLSGMTPRGGTYLLILPRRLGPVQCSALLALKPSNYGKNASSDASRHATLKGLDPPELARTALRLARRLKEAVKVLKGNAPLQPHSDIFKIEPALWYRHSLHQNASKTACLLVFINVMSPKLTSKVRCVGCHL